MGFSGAIRLHKLFPLSGRPAHTVLLSSPVVHVAIRPSSVGPRRLSALTLFRPARPARSSPSPADRFNRSPTQYSVHQMRLTYYHDVFIYSVTPNDVSTFWQVMCCCCRIQQAGAVRTCLIRSHHQPLALPKYLAAETTRLLLFAGCYLPARRQHKDKGYKLNKGGYCRMQHTGRWLIS
jgi:hypothetical protein